MSAVRHRATTSDVRGDFKATTSVTIELEEPVRDLELGCSADGQPYVRVIALARWAGDVLGVVDIPAPEGVLTASELAQHLWTAVGDRIAADDAASGGLRGRGPEALLRGLGRGTVPRTQDDRPRVTVIVPTAGRPQRIGTCLEFLRRMSYPSFDILVVDNAPEDPRTRSVVGAHAVVDARVRYVAEPLPGSSVARNRGIREAGSSILAFTDDDVHVDRHWLSFLVAPMLEDPRVGVVTGLILPEKLDTPEQAWFESYSGFGKGLMPEKFDLHDHRPMDRPLFPYWGGVFGSGNNMAFRRPVLLEMGGFDPAMGAGSRALGGADVASFSQAVLAGHRLAYEPRALGWHDHRASEAALRKQTFSYAVGLTAVFTKWTIRDPRFGLSMAREVAALGRGIVRARRRTSASTSAPEVSQFALQLRMNRERGVLARQLTGFAVGPVLYLRSVLWARRLGLYGVLPQRAPHLSGEASP